MVNIGTGSHAISQSIAWCGDFNLHSLDFKSILLQKEYSPVQPKVLFGWEIFYMEW